VKGEEAARLESVCTTKGDDIMDTALLVLRFAVGVLVAGHGAQKLFGWFGGRGLGAMSGMLASKGFRPASAWALTGALAEFGGGLLLALGLFSPLGAIGVGSAMLTAITKVHWPKLWAAEGGFEFPLTNLAVAVAVGIAGPGAYSLDAAWGTSLSPAVSRIAVALALVGYLVGMITSAARSPEQQASR
jgi:putative oxidoreductase